MSTDKLQQLMLKDLARSGIPATCVIPLGLKCLDSEETTLWMKSKEEFNVNTYEIPYFNGKGVRTGYSRLKNMTEGKRFGSAKKKQTFKYLQRANTAPHLYFPPIYEWPRNKDGKISLEKLVITEGEKKAIKACLCDIPCVALGGVDAFKSSKRGIFLIEEFEDFDLSITDVEICYDSDLNTNESVRKAMYSLAAELARLNPLSIGYVMLDGESAGDGKLGLDDFLKPYKPKAAKEAFNALPRRVDTRQDKFALLNNDLCYLKSAGRVYNIPDDRYYESAAAVVLDYGPKMRIPDPEDPRKQVPAVKLWLEERSEETWCEALVYEPGRAKRYKESKDKGDYINLWRPSPVEPVEGDCELWLTLVRYVMRTEKNFNWFMQWLAYPFQNPGIKVLTGVFVWSRANGVGKNFIIEPLIRKIYDKSYAVISADDLSDSFNTWAKCKQFIFGEEIYMSDKRDRLATMGQLKSLITNEYVTINGKYRPPELFKNYAQFYLTSNHSDALSIDSADRRIMVVHAPEDPLEDEFYRKLNDWCEKKDSAGKVMNYLLNQVDVSTFNPKAEAIYTADKEEMIEQGLDMVQNYIQLIIKDPETVYENNGVLPDQQLFSADEIFKAVNNYARNNNMPELRLSPLSLGRYLVGSNIPTHRLSISSSFRTRLYAVFNRKVWRRCTKPEWGAHYRTYSMRFKEKKVSKIQGNPKKPADNAAMKAAVGEEKKVLQFPTKG